MPGEADAGPALGARAISFPENTVPLGLPSYWTNHFDPVWQACQDEDIVLCLHIGTSGRIPDPSPGDAPASLSYSLLQLGSIESSVYIMMSPVCRNYPGLSNARRITFEYVMLKGVNDSLAEARALVKLLAGIPAKINLIPFNPWPGTRYECSDWETIERFAEVVNRAGYASPVRTPRGRDILAACGQLKSASTKLKASERAATENS